MKELGKSAYRCAISTMFDGFFIMDESGNFIDVNNRYLVMSGYSKEEFLKLKLSQLESPLNTASSYQQLLSLYHNGIDKFESVHRRKDGSLYPVEIHFSNDDRCLKYTYICVRDLSSAKKAETKVSIVENIFENSNEAIVVTDSQGNIEIVNDTFCQITGYSHFDVIGKTPAILNSGRQDKNFYQKFWRQLTTSGSWSGEIWNKRKGGEIYPEWLNISSIRNESGEITHYVAQFTDITTTKRSEEEQLFRAYHDPLTSLPNRTLLFERLEHLCEKNLSTPTQFAVLFCDLDRFKFINDSLGHHIGDEVLKLVAERIKAKLRTSDTVARVGGDEFIIIIEGEESLNHIENIAKQILALFDQPFSLNVGEFYISASIGISIFPDDSCNIRELISFADIAMYQVKSAGGNHYNLFDTKQKEDIKHKIELEAVIHKALQEDQFQVWYQPQINSRTGEVYGVECLLRWIHPEYGYIRPDLFIPIAEGTGLIKDIGYYVLKTACRQLRQWRVDNIFKGKLAVNVSLKQFERNDLYAQVKQLLEEELISGELLELEVTESMFSEDNLYHVKVLQKLRGLGVKISIDDFGTGYSSLQRLKQLPIDNLKIDKSFVDNLTNSKLDISIVKALCMLVETFGIDVIAEGVENEQQANLLIDLGCPNHQGFLYSKALSAKDFEAWLKTFNT